ncbi:MAG: P-type conjugative transfer ATPase TrbB [Betaproteobacteria bacterium]|nr:P-type conjugative transfer ATPase TrbB [Betaproteobacteria bacterium]
MTTAAAPQPRSHTATERRRSAAPGYTGPERRRIPFAYAVDNEKTRLLKYLAHAFGHEVHELLQDPTVTEVWLNSDGMLWAKVARVGKRKIGPVPPADAENAIRLVAHHIRCAVGPENPSFAAELPGSGWRFQASLPPQTPGPAFNIRKKAGMVYTLDQYVADDIMTVVQRDAIMKAVHARDNMMVVGGTETGKTTLVNAILHEMAKRGERIITIEDTLELQNTAEDKEELRTVTGVRGMHDLLRDALRMSPDRIVVGEVRGVEVIDMLDAWNTGHPGGVCTIHADSAESALLRIESLIRRSRQDPDRESIARTIQLLICIQKVRIDTPEGLREVRRVTEILRITGAIEGVYRFEKVA